MIDTGIKFCGRRVLIESSGNAQIDKDIRQIFRDDFFKSCPLSMSRGDIQRVLAYNARHYAIGEPLKNHQGLLFEDSE